jgi:long-chain acyl-CoA synthetase
VSNSIVSQLKNAFDRNKRRIALRWRNQQRSRELNYEDFEEHIEALALGLLDKGVNFQQRIGLFADLSAEWTMVNLSIQWLGAIDVPRGTDSTSAELTYIIEHSGLDLSFVHYASEIDKIASERSIENLVFIVMDNRIPGRLKDNAVTMHSLLQRGRKLRAAKSELLNTLKENQAQINSQSINSVIYTSGTTGVPKGVVLDHSNMLYQLDAVPKVFRMQEKDRCMTLLPPWHIFGRLVEYVTLLNGAMLIHTDLRTMAQDLQELRPTFIPAVPRVWEKLYNRMQLVMRKTGKERAFQKHESLAAKYFNAKITILNQVPLQDNLSFFGKAFSILKSYFLFPILWLRYKLGDILVARLIRNFLGGRVRLVISGASALPGHLDLFYNSFKIPLMEGYGLTETSGVVSARLPNRLVPGSVGPPIDGTQVRLIDFEGNPIQSKPNATGTLCVKGPQVMQGYYKDEEKTDEVLQDGWFNTGDIVRLGRKGELTVIGRSKETIVLLGGENVEPVPIEERFKESKYIENCMIVGQDQKFLGVLLIPNETELADYVRKVGMRSTSLQEWVESKEVLNLFQGELNRLVNDDPSFKFFEKVRGFQLLASQFIKGDELNNTLKLKRHRVNEKYSLQIQDIFATAETAMSGKNA